MQQVIDRVAGVGVGRGRWGLGGRLGWGGVGEHGHVMMRESVTDVRVT